MNALNVNLLLLRESKIQESPARYIDIHYLPFKAFDDPNQLQLFLNCEPKKFVQGFYGLFGGIGCSEPAIFALPFMSAFYGSQP